MNVYKEEGTCRATVVGAFNLIWPIASHCALHAESAATGVNRVLV